MPTIPPCFIADMRVKTNWGLYKNRFYYSLTRDLEDEADVEAVCSAILAHVGTPFAQVLSNEVTIEGVDGRWYGPAGQDLEGTSPANEAITGYITGIEPGEILDDGESVAGVGGVDQMPDDVVLMIQLRTGQAGRSKRGRRFFSGVHESVQNEGQILDDYFIKLTAFANAINSDVTGISLPTAGGAGTAHARHWDRKNNLLHPITKTYVMGCMMSRMDRRPKQLMRRIAG